MELGELLHDDLFGLFEAMSAIEMMDPKMDAGMAKVGGTIKRKNSPVRNKLFSVKLNNYGMPNESE